LYLFALTENTVKTGCDEAMRSYIHVTNALVPADRKASKPHQRKNTTHHTNTLGVLAT
jgi:hypothetical protein